MFVLEQFFFDVVGGVVVHDVVPPLADLEFRQDDRDHITLSDIKFLRFDEFKKRLDDFSERRIDHFEGNPHLEFLVPLPDEICGLIIRRHCECRNVRPFRDGERIAQRPHAGLVDAFDGNDDVVAVYRVHFFENMIIVVCQFQLSLHGIVMFLGLVHQENQDGDKDHNDIGAILEFFAGDDDHRDESDNRTESVDRRLQVPVWTLVLEPSGEHSTLGKGEGDKNSDRIKADQQGHFRFENDNQDNGNDGKDDDAVVIGQLVAAGMQLPGRIAVFGNHGDEHRKIGISGVRRQNQYKKRGGSQKIIHEGGVAENLFRHQDQHGPLSGNHMEIRRQDGGSAKQE